MKWINKGEILSSFDGKEVDAWYSNHPEISGVGKNMAEATKDFKKNWLLNSIKWISQVYNSYDNGFKGYRAKVGNLSLNLCYCPVVKGWRSTVYDNKALVYLFVSDKNLGLLEAKKQAKEFIYGQVR